MLELHYWPGIQGRGEFIRLALEASGTPYLDVARGPREHGQGVEAMTALLGSAELPRPPFACPFIVDGRRVIGQTAAILQYLGPRLGLVPAGEMDRLWVHQVQLTIADLVTEVHDLHHPVGTSLYYEDQKAEAARRAEDFRRNRLPKFIGWFETLLERNPPNDGAQLPHLVGARLCYADLSLFQVVDGLLYALPKATRRVLKKAPFVSALHERIPLQRRVAAYLASERRLPFNEEGIFRHYPELDG